MTHPNSLAAADLFLSLGLALGKPRETRALSETDIQDLARQHRELVYGIAESLPSWEAVECDFTRYLAAVTVSHPEIMQAFLARGVVACDGDSPIGEADNPTQFLALRDIGEKTERALGTRIHDIAVAAVMPDPPALSMAWH